MSNSKARILADFISTGAGTGILADGAVSPTEITGVTVSAAELNALGGVTGPIQAQINTKAAASSLSTVATTGSYTDLSGRPSLGSVAALDVGTNANQVVQLDANGKLPAVDGGQLTNIQGYSIASALAFE